MQPTVVYSNDPRTAGRRIFETLAEIPTNQRLVFKPDTVTEVYGFRRDTGEEIALRFEPTPAEYLRQMREVRGTK